MNRSEKRRMKRQAAKDANVYHSTLLNPQDRAKHGSLIRGAFKDGQIYGNNEWAVRLLRIYNVKGIGEKLADAIYREIEKPITQKEREFARKLYEQGGNHIEFGNLKADSENRRADKGGNSSVRSDEKL